MDWKFNNLDRWQKVGAAIVTAVAVWGIIPNDIKLMTRGEHNTDAQYSKETTATQSIHYYEWKRCDRETGLPNSKHLSPFRQGKLNKAYDKYFEATGEEYPLGSMGQSAKCQVLFEDGL